MVLNQGGSAVLAAVSVLSLFLALSVYYVVDNIARPAEDSDYRNNSDEINTDISEKQKVVNPLTEILYHQLFQNKPLEICPIYFSNICKWNLIGDQNITEDENTNTTKQKLKQFNGVILRSCQIFGIVKYQDVCFYTGNNLYKAIPDTQTVAQILNDCSYINDNGYPCILRQDSKYEDQIPRNVCVSDSKTLVNVLTQRCRVREKSIDPTNSSDYVPFEDIIYEEETKKYRNEKVNGGGVRKKGESEGDGNQQYKSGSNKTTTGTNATAVVCHILLAALLVVSASVALYEVCRDRLSENKLGQQSIVGGDGRINAIGSRSYSLDSRRCSLVDLTVSRHARRESIQQLTAQQPGILQDTSNSSAATARGSQIKLLGARPPPLLRRSSFPAHIGAAATSPHHSFSPKEHVQSPSGTATPNKIMSRRTSVDASEDDSSPDMTKRRVRFLRRH
ncbi:uncharacterized protein [Periplaneta americana]|uniref:uncharacterized protein n=1 Tax=Periplaneta americana TaxID=6978 RepID=UPI0037E76D7E